LPGLGSDEYRGFLALGDFSEPIFMAGASVSPLLDNKSKSKAKEVRLIPDAKKAVTAILSPRQRRFCGRSPHHHRRRRHYARRACHSKTLAESGYNPG
jgi:hypothetical protein